MDAFFFIDKPTGQTSFQVLRDMRKILWVKKIGHSGTLDPLATWGLLVATGQYTKLITYVEKDTKSYRADIMLDGESPSYDSDSEVEFLSLEDQEKHKNSISKAGLEEIFQKNFYGKILQVPPKYSALKIDGKRAMDRMRAGEDVEMKKREAEILVYNIVLFEYPKLVVEIRVTAGTYIRSIAHDLGEILGTWGYLSALRRTGVGSLDISSSTLLENLEESQKLDIPKLFPGRVFLFQDETVLKRLSDGQRVWGEYDFPTWQDIFLFDGNMVRYVVEYKDSVLHPRKKVV
jgi:tRNA pseudouridine55 synthase